MMCDLYFVAPHTSGRYSLVNSICNAVFLQHAMCITSSAAVTNDYMTRMDDVVCVYFWAVQVNHSF